MNVFLMFIISPLMLIWLSKQSIYSTDWECKMPFFVTFYALFLISTLTVIYNLIKLL